jgi:DNA-binding transcriptional ArsR family regulator
VSSAVDDDLWSAIGDPTRRHILDVLLAAGVGTATTLSNQVPITRQAVTKHLQVLDRAGLVNASVAGRERQYKIDSAQLARAAAQLAEVGANWDGRLQRIKHIAEQIQRASYGPAEAPALQPDLPETRAPLPTEAEPVGGSTRVDAYPDGIRCVGDVEHQ